MASPTRRKGSDSYHFRRRVPADVAGALAGPAPLRAWASKDFRGTHGMHRVGKLASFLLMAIVAGVYLNNTTLLAPQPLGKPTLLAHRGVAQGFETVGLK